MDGGNSHPFMYHPSAKRSFGAMSASRRDDTPDPSGLAAYDDHYHNEHSSRRPRLPHPTSHHRPVHYPGDGLDFRRPVMSTSAAARESSVSEMRNGATVIDLTDEDGIEESQRSELHHPSIANAGHGVAGSSRAQRLPRFGRAVIDVESSAEEDEEEPDTSNLPGASFLALPPRHPLPRRPPQFSGLRRPARPPSPPVDMDEVEIIEERPRSRPRSMSRQFTPAAPVPPRALPRSVTPYPTNIHQTIDLTQDHDDDVVLLNTRQREGVNQDPPNVPAARGLADRGLDLANALRQGGMHIGERLVQRLHEYTVPVQHFTHIHDHRHGAPRHYHNYQRPEGGNDARHVHIHYGVPAPAAAHPGMPINLDYHTTGFDMGMGGNRPPTPKYSPPPEPEEGFTRSPGEDEVVVCPNCGDELAMGDSDVKQEVWVVKACGHAYCGECAQNRGKSSSSKKGKGKAPAMDINGPQPFKKCVVEGCGKPAAKNSMVHVYFGS